jgi:hypothetical protein
MGGKSTEDVACVLCPNLVWSQWEHREILQIEENSETIIFL